MSAPAGLPAWLVRRVLAAARHGALDLADPATHRLVARRAGVATSAVRRVAGPPSRPPAPSSSRVERLGRC